MKRYISLIAICLVTLLLMTFIFYILLRQDNSYIMYIRLQVNPSFVIGINENKNVVFYNALNEDGNKYNLAMFQGKTLEEATKIFVEKLGNAKENKDEINITVMTKDNVKEKEIVEIIEKNIKSFDNHYKIIVHEPSSDDLERFSNETVYNLEASLTNEDLKMIGKTVYKKVDEHINEKISSLNLSKLSLEKQISLLKEKQEEGYFSDYLLENMVIDEYKVILLEKSNYTIVFTYEENNTYSYRLILNMDVEYEKDSSQKIVEVYTYSYELGEDLEKISSLKKHFYML